MTAPAHTFGLPDDPPDEAFADPNEPGDATPGRAPAGRSDLDLIAAELTEELDLQPITVDVPGRPGWALLVDVNVDSNALAAWQRRSRDQGWPSGTNDLKLAAIIIANQTRDLVRQGESQGLNFRDKRTLTALGAVDARSAVLKVFGGRDVAVMAVGERILAAAGHIDADSQRGDDDDGVRPPSPTKRRSRD